MKFKLVIDKNAEEEITAVVHRPSALTQQIENLICGFSGTDSIIGSKDDEIRKLLFCEIEFITIIERKLIATDTCGSCYRIQGTLRELEQILPSYFIRINKSTIANEHRILKFNAVYNGAVDAIFQCGCRDYVSRRCFSEIRRRYKENEKK